MDLHARDHDRFPGTPEHQAQALGIITAIVVIAGFAMVAAWFALLLLDDRHHVPSGRAATICNICGVVERVSEVRPAPPQQLEGSRAEGAVILLAALGGARAPNGRPLTLYETSVLHDDGSIRVLRNQSAPQWARGDRVKVVKGLVEPVSSPEERTQSPGLQAVQAR